MDFEPFDDSFFGETLTVTPQVWATDSDMGMVNAASAVPPTQFSVYLEPQTSQAVYDSEGNVIKVIKPYNIMSKQELGQIVNGVFSPLVLNQICAVGDQVFAVNGGSQDLSGSGVIWRTEAVEVS